MLPINTFGGGGGRGRVVGRYHFFFREIMKIVKNRLVSLKGIERGMLIFFSPPPFFLLFAVFYNMNFLLSVVGTQLVEFH